MKKINQTIQKVLDNAGIPKEESKIIVDVIDITIKKMAQDNQSIDNIIKTVQNIIQSNIKIKGNKMKNQNVQLSKKDLNKALKEAGVPKEMRAQAKKEILEAIDSGKIEGEISFTQTEKVFDDSIEEYKHGFIHKGYPIVKRYFVQKSSFDQSLESNKETRKDGIFILVGNPKEEKKLIKIFKKEKIQLIRHGIFRIGESQDEIVKSYNLYDFAKPGKKKFLLPSRAGSGVSLEG